MTSMALADPVTEIAQAESEEDLRQIRLLFREYSVSLNFSLHSQGFEKELAEFSGDYAPPDGRVLLARQGAEAVGCVALRKISDGACEMKRLYVSPAFRGRRLGRRLAQAVIADARKIGYARMRLDTRPSMKEAVALYESLGFQRIKPYRFNPIDGVIYLELRL